MADPRAQAKRAAAEAAVEEIDAGMIVGLGTGTTAAFAIAALGLRVADGLAVRTASTSLATARAAAAAGIPALAFQDVGYVDLAIDGADEVDSAFRCTKGGGGAMLREKIVAASAGRMICIVDEAKLVPALGTVPLPVEVLPFAQAFVSNAVRALGGEPVLRLSADMRPTLSDQGNLLIDCRFGRISDPPGLAAALSAVPGLLGHGLFLTEIDSLFVGGVNGVERKERPSGGT